jgi:DUF4097 and DUF4098 domain-containing protein YvlB
MIRIGDQHDNENLHNISIDYEIEAPADAKIDAATASGNVTDTGVGTGARLMTASGNVMATGLEGGFRIQTGSGSINIENTGEGDSKAQAGSGSIHLKGVRGALIAETGSGTIVAAGTPTSAWKLATGSGTIELTTGNAAMTLDASVGSGSISTPPGMVQASDNKHHLHVDLNGGGPVVKVQTGSGSIKVQ